MNDMYTSFSLLLMGMYLLRLFERIMESMNDWASSINIKMNHYNLFIVYSNRCFVMFGKIKETSNKNY